MSSNGSDVTSEDSHSSEITFSEETQSRSQIAKSILKEKYGSQKLIKEGVPTWSDLLKSRISLSDFDILKVIGRGAFGEVMLVRKKDSKEVLALKKLIKKEMMKKKQILHVRAERDILAHSNNPVCNIIILLLLTIVLNNDFSIHSFINSILISSTNGVYVCNSDTSYHRYEW